MNRKPILVFTFLAFLVFVAVVCVLFWQKDKWDGVSRFTVIDLGSPVRILSFDPATKRGLKFNLPDDLWINTLLGRGKFPVSSLSAAGSPAWAASSIADDLGIFSYGEIAGLNWIDRLRWWWKSRQIQWQDLDLTKSGLVSYQTTTDGAKQGSLTSLWDQTAAEWFSSLAVAQEKLTLQVVNTTQVEGLAAITARAIDSSGMKVIKVSNSADMIDKCQLVGPKALQKSIGVELLMKHFNCNWKTGGQLILFLGREFQRSITGEN